jgi:V8-like Glu-specific endopeptidase
MYEMSGTINEIIQKENLLDIITYTNIDTTQGQSGSPVLVWSKHKNPEIIAVHTSHLSYIPANGGNVITKEIKSWIDENYKSEDKKI